GVAVRDSEVRVLPPQPLIALRFLRFCGQHFQRSRERSREIFVPGLISTCLSVAVQFFDSIASGPRTPRRGVGGLGRFPAAPALSGVGGKPSPRAAPPPPPHPRRAARR